MKFVLYSTLIFLLLQCSCGSDFIRQSCRNTSNSDPNIGYGFCVACLEANPERQPARIEELVEESILITEDNTTNVISNVSKLLKNQSFSQQVKVCLEDCFVLYSDARFQLQDARNAFKSKDLDTANVKVSAALDASVTCEDQFKENKGEASPLTKDNKIYFQLNAMSLAFIQMNNRKT